MTHDTFLTFYHRNVRRNFLLCYAACIFCSIYAVDKCLFCSIYKGVVMHNYQQCNVMHVMVV